MLRAVRRQVEGVVMRQAKGEGRFRAIMRAGVRL